MSNKSQALLDPIQGFSESEIVRDTICILNGFNTNILPFLDTKQCNILMDKQL